MNQFTAERLQIQGTREGAKPSFYYQGALAAPAPRGYRSCLPTARRAVAAVAQVGETLPIGFYLPVRDVQARSIGVDWQSKGRSLVRIDARFPELVSLTGAALHRVGHNQQEAGSASEGASTVSEGRLFEQPRYLQSTFTLVLPEQRDVACHEKQIYGRLRPRYFPAQSARVPSLGDAEQPGLVFNSQHGHSQIVVGASSIVLNVVYSQDWQTKPPEAQQYIHERMGLVFDATEVFEDVPLLFCGSMTRVHLRSGAADDDVVQALAQVFVRSPTTDPYHDLVLRMTTVVDDLFFDNITVQNYRTWNLGLGQGQGSTLRLARKQAVERGVEVAGDFNSRYAFNEGKDFEVTRQAAEQIIARNLESVAKVASLLEGGRA